MEEDPTERLRMIQDAARNAGLDIANMSRVEMNYLSDLTGMGVEDTMKALSEGGLEMQSQLGEVPDVAKSAQEQTAQLIKAQEGIAGTLQTFQKDLPNFIDNAATVAKNLGETGMKALSEGGLEMQSQLGEVPDVKKSAQEQTAQLIKAQEGIAGTLQTFQKDLPGFIDNAATVAKNLGETGLLRGTTLKKAGEALGQSFTDVTSSTLKLVMSDAAKEASSVIMKGLLGAKIGEKGRFQGGALQAVTKQVTGGIKIAEGIATAGTEGLKEGKTPGEILKDAREKAAPGAKEVTDASQDLGKLIQGVTETTIDAATGKKKTPEPPKPETPTATAATPQAAEAPATPAPAKQPKPKVDAGTAGSPPAPADDVTVNTKSDGSGNFRGEADVPAGTQKIVIMIGEKEVGEAVLLPVMKSQFPPQGFDATTVGGRIAQS